MRGSRVIAVALGGVDVVEFGVVKSGVVKSTLISLWHELNKKIKAIKKNRVGLVFKAIIIFPSEVLLHLE